MATAMNPNDFTVVELKEKLRALNLPATGNKCELIQRLLEADPSGVWMTEMQRVHEENESGVSDVTPRDNTSESERALSQREVEIYKKEKELAERELQIARQEIELLRGFRQMTTSNGNERQQVVEGAANQTLPVGRQQANLRMIADLLDIYNGEQIDYLNWERKLKSLKITYKLSDEETRILAGTKLKGKALEWLHSKPEHLEMPLETLLASLRSMFHHRPNKTILRKQFEARIWKRSESFHEYVHDKIILGNRVPIDEDEIVNYIIDGIPDVGLKDQARMQRFTTAETLLEAFEEITLQERSFTGPAGNAKDSGRNFHGHPRISRSDERKGQRNEKCVCFNCGMPDHMANKCPSKAEGVKCFKCQERGHIASKCPKKVSTVQSDDIVKCLRKKYYKDVKLNGLHVSALIDTGSDLSLIRADQYVKIGSPELSRKEVKFRGIGSGENTTLGEFCTQITIDNENFPITLKVVSDTLMQHSLLIGTDFLDSVEMNVKAGKISINKLIPANQIDSAIEELCQIDCSTEVNEIDVSYISDFAQRDVVESLIQNYKPEKTRDVNMKMTLILKDDEPVYQRPRRLAPSEREKVNEQVNEWMRDDIVQPSLSEYASPIVLVKKKDGTIRLCVDYRELNKKIIRDRYPLPLIEDQLDSLQGARFFTTIDLKNGFFHVLMDEQSIKYTAFVVPDGQYEFLRVPFGLCNSPSVFQRFINIVFKELIREKTVMAYMDDLIIPSADRETGLKNLRIVLNVASEAGLIINWKKCCFLQSRVEFLGHIIEDGCIRPSKRKTEAVQNFPEPTNVKQIQSFLGLSGYFRKFVPGYSSIARPLSDLLKANVRFKFKENERDAFMTLKGILCSEPVLSIYKQGSETELHTDASMHGYGAILLQKSSDDNALHPVYYASGKTTSAESKYTSYELEVLAIVKSLRKFRIYLLGIPFKIVTDCRAFSLTMRKKDLCVRVARWALLLEEFNYTIEHRPGKSMTHVDALSRQPLPKCMLADSAKDTLMAQFERAQREDTDVNKIRNLAIERKIEGYVIRGNLLFKEVDAELLLVVPKSMRNQIIRQAHERGHFSVAKTEALLKRDYWILNARPKIEKIVKNCVSCILAERKQGKQEGLLNSIEKGEIPLDTYHVDHLGPLPSTKKSYHHIFVVTDAFSKYVWLYATKTTNTTEVVNRLKKQAIVFGNPRRIISDRGTAFTSKEFADYCTEEKIEHQLITTGVPRSNGQVERINRTLIPLLTKLAYPKKEEWYRHLDSAQQCLNVTLHRSIGMTPFRLMFGTHPRLRENPEIVELLEKEWISKFESERNELRIRASENISKLQSENRALYNKKRKKANIYREDDLVAIKRTRQEPGLKFAGKFIGPYKIIRCLRGDRYIVEKAGDHEGPLKTSTAVDFMKPWVQDLSDSSDDELDESTDDIRVGYICRTAEV